MVAPPPMHAGEERTRAKTLTLPKRSQPEHSLLKNGIGSSYLVKFVFPATSTPTAPGSHGASREGATADWCRSWKFTARSKKTPNPKQNKKIPQKPQHDPNDIPATVVLLQTRWDEGGVFYLLWGIIWSLITGSYVYGSFGLQSSVSFRWQLPTWCKQPGWSSSLPITALYSYFTAEQWGNSISQAMRRSSCSPASPSSETGSRTSPPSELQATTARPDLREPFPRLISSRYHFPMEPVRIPTTFNTLQKPPRAETSLQGAQWISATRRGVY